jgi:hypothetical protein
MLKYKVLINYRNIDKKSSVYGELIEHCKLFKSFDEAIFYARNVKYSINMEVIGLPIIEQVA